MKTTKRFFNLKKTIMIILMFLAVVLLAGCASADTNGLGFPEKPVWQFCSVLFIVLDIIEAIVIIILSVILFKINKKRKLLSAMNSFTGFIFLSAMSTSLISILIFLLLFATICDLSYRISVAKSKPIEKAFNKDILKPKEIYDYTNEEKQNSLKERTVEEWYDIEKPICLEQGDNVLSYLETETTNESMYVGNGEGYPNRVTALKMLFDEFSEEPVEEVVEESVEEVVEEPVEEYVKSVEEWYEEEKATIASLDETKLPIEYVDEELATETDRVNEGNGFENRVSALQILHNEYYVEPVKTIEEWYQEEKEIISKFDSDIQPIDYIDAQIVDETDKVNKGIGFENRLSALNMLHDEYYVEPIKTVEEWYQEEKVFVDKLENDNMQPIEYIDQEIVVETEKINEGTGYANRLTALNILHDELYVEPVKTVEEWYEIEKPVCVDYANQDRDPVEYINSELAIETNKVNDGTGYENRVEALKTLYEEFYIKTVEEWYAIEKPVCENLITKEKDPMKYISTQLNSETKKVAKGEGKVNRVTALQMLHDEYYVKPVELWYKEEREICESLTDKTPTEYIDEELVSEKQKVVEGSGFANRVEALELLAEDLIEEKIEAEEEAKPKLSQEEEALLRDQEILAARQAYVDSKKKGEEAVVPVMAFLLSREDILDYVEKMVGNKYPVIPSIRRRKKKYMSDSLKCGVWTFALMYEKNGVVKLIARMEDEYVEKLQEIHTGIKKSAFPKNGNWYDVIFDSSYASKDEVYEIIEYLYNYILNKYYTYDELTKTYVTDEVAATTELEEIVLEAEEKEKDEDDELELAIKEFELSLQQYREKYKVPFKTSREKIQKYVKRIHFDSELITRDKPHKPSTLKWTENNKAYVMFYEKEGNVWMIIRCYDKYAKMLQRYHPLTARARFPRPHNWYVVHIDGTYKTSGAIYKVIKNAKKYVMDGCPKEIEKPKKKKEAKKVTKKPAKKAKTKKADKKTTA